MRALLADRDARLYLGGQALSTIGGGKGQASRPS
jgi:hypothetical protein